MLDSKWMFPKIVVAQNGWFIMENLIKMDDLGVTPSFGNTQIAGTWGYPVLLHPMLHLQQSLQLKLPGLDFWEASAAIDLENLGKNAREWGPMKNWTGDSLSFLLECAWIKPWVLVLDFFFTPIPGEDDPIWRAYFSKGLKQTTN